MNNGLAADSTTRGKGQKGGGHRCNNQIKVAAMVAVALVVAVAALNGTSELQSKMIFMGHQILSCHIPVFRSFFIL
jgi:hypothetical protein